MNRRTPLPVQIEGEVTEPIVSFSTIFDAEKETDTPDE